jgi:tripartite ATP-independent transporter DctM subunit
VIYRTLTWQHLVHSAFETLKSTSAILVIVAAAALFGWIMAIEQIPQVMARSLLSLSTDPLMLLLIVNGILLIAGMFLDSTTATLLIVPIIAAPLHLAGVDPVHLGIVAIFNLMLGLVTPPMGLALFLITDIAQVSMRAVLRELMPFYIPLLATLAIITFFPEVSLWIPKMIR